MKFRVTFAQVKSSTYEVEAEEQGYAVIKASKLWLEDESPPSVTNIREV